MERGSIVEEEEGGCGFELGRGSEDGCVDCIDGGWGGTLGISGCAKLR